MVSPRLRIVPIVSAAQVTRTIRLQAVGGAEIRPSVSGTIQHQQLMPEQDGFGENCQHASGTNQTNQDGHDMDE